MRNVARLQDDSVITRNDTYRAGHARTSRISPRAERAANSELHIEDITAFNNASKVGKNVNCGLSLNGRSLAVRRCNNSSAAAVPHSCGRTARWYESSSMIIGIER